MVTHTSGFYQIADVAPFRAPDQLDVQQLAFFDAGEICQFTLAPNRTGRAIRHATVTELWFVHSGTGEVWLRGVADDQPRQLAPGDYFIVTAGTDFQVCNQSTDPLRFLAITTPRFPKDSDAEITLVDDACW